MEKRITEITTGMKTFTKELYHKSEVLTELLELQNELVTLTFNEEHAEKGNLRIWDVENRFEKMNANCGNVADEQLEKFKADCKIICNTIKAEMSGQAGEYKAFRSLETLRCNNAIIKNVEFVLGDHRTELDAIVITEKGVFIIEVKNPAKDIYIDERGNYCRVSDTLIFDKNIAEKMNDKEYLLREALKKTGIENINIVNMVVFTNSSMHVENKYPYINTCYLSDLPHKIGGYIGERIYTEADIDAMVVVIEENKCHEAYPMPIDMQKFKVEFATLMAILEKATKNPDNSIESDEAEVIENLLPTENAKRYQKTLDWMKKHKKTSHIVASIAIVAMASIFDSILRSIFSGGSDDKGCDWYCDECDTYMNSQPGFTTSSGEWTCTVCGCVNDVPEDNIIYDDDYDEEDSERISAWDAADIWRSHGKDEDYMFGYTEEELEDA